MASVRSPFRTPAASRTFDCIAKGLAKDGAKVVTDRGVVVAWRPGDAIAFALVGSNAIVFDVDRAAGHDSLAAVVAGGAPLRSARAFSDKYRAVPADAALWAIANETDPLLREINARAADATLFLTDRLEAEAHIDVASTDEATQLAATLTSQAAAWRDLADQLEIAAQGSAVRIHVIATRLDTLVTLLLRPD